MGWGEEKCLAAPLRLLRLGRGMSEFWEVDAHSLETNDPEMQDSSLKVCLRGIFFHFFHYLH